MKNKQSSEILREIRNSYRYHNLWNTFEDNKRSTVNHMTGNFIAYNKNATFTLVLDNANRKDLQTFKKRLILLKSIHLIERPYDQKNYIIVVQASSQQKEILQSKFIIDTMIDKWRYILNTPVMKISSRPIQNMIFLDITSKHISNSNLKIWRHWKNLTHISIKTLRMKEGLEMLILNMPIMKNLMSLKLQIRNYHEPVISSNLKTLMAKISEFRFLISLNLKIIIDDQSTNISTTNTLAIEEALSSLEGCNKLQNFSLWFEIQEDFGFTKRICIDMDILTKMLASFKSLKILKLLLFLNPLQNSNSYEKLGKYLGKLTEIKLLELNLKILKNEHFDLLTRELKHLHNLEEFISYQSYETGKNIGREEIDNLANFLKLNGKLKKLIINLDESSPVIARSIFGFFDALSSCSMLISLDLTLKINNWIFEMCDSFKNCLQNLKHLTSLSIDLKIFEMENDSKEVIFDLFSQFHDLHKLTIFIQDESFCNSNFSRLGKAIATNNNLKSFIFYLHEYEALFNEDGLMQFWDYIKNLSHLTKLNIQVFNDNLTAQCFYHLLGAFSQLKKLSNIFTQTSSNNQMDPEIILKLLRKILNTNKNIKYIDYKFEGRRVIDHVHPNPSKANKLKKFLRETQPNNFYYNDRLRTIRNKNKSKNCLKIRITK